MKTITVDLGERSYPICIGEAMQSRFSEALQRAILCKNCIIVSDENVARLYAQTIIASLKQQDVRSTLIVVPAGEQSKRLGYYEMILSRMIGAAAGRDWPVLALGGGVVGDLAGFVAASYMRGVPLVQIPTTLLAQVDSSVGGKVGINHPAAKNIIGAFYQPKLVWIDSAFLKTLPERELICGFAEVVKYGIIFDRSFFSFCEQNLNNILQLDPQALNLAIERSCAIKAEIVARDEHDWGQREILNFGHTIGHALEASLGYANINHGEAVLWGMRIEAMIAEKIGAFPRGDAVQFQRFLAQIPLKATIVGIEPENVFKSIQLDKKARGGKIRFALPVAIGKTKIVDHVEHETIVHSLQQACAHPWTDRI